MRFPAYLVVLALSLFLMSSALAGGAACQFQANGLPLLRSSPALCKLVTTSFVVTNGGLMGPSDAPFEGRRLYTYMEFQTSSVHNPKDRFILRIHFQRKGESKLAFQSVEILPLPPASEPG